MTIKEDGNKIIDEQFMMATFEELYEELNPFQEYRDHVYAERKTCVVGSNKVKVIPLKLLRDERFSPEDDTNKETSAMAAVLVLWLLLPC